VSPSYFSLLLSIRWWAFPVISMPTPFTPPSFWP
jgi:hypothetical protein